MRVDDFPQLVASQTFWARKFDTHSDSLILDKLEKHIAPTALVH